MRILIATGGSDYNEMAIEKACAMVVKPSKTEIQIISAYRDIAALSPERLEITLAQLEKIQAAERKQSEEFASDAEKIVRKRFPDASLSVSTKIVQGSAKKVILEEADKWHADLIIVGAMADNKSKRLLLGAVAEAIVRYANCSVLVIRGEVEDE